MINENRSSPSRRPLRVIILDDESLVLATLELYIRSRFKSASILSMSDAEAAYQELLRDPPNVFISDVCHPPPDGFELLRRLRAVGARYPIIILSGFASKDEVMRHAGRELNITFLCKPTSRDEFIQHLCLLVGGDATGPTMLPLDASGAMQTGSQVEKGTDVDYETGGLLPVRDTVSGKSIQDYILQGIAPPEWMKANNEENARRIHERLAREAQSQSVLAGLAERGGDSESVESEPVLFWDKTVGRAIRWLVFVPVSLTAVGIGEFIVHKAFVWWARLPSIVSYITFVPLVGVGLVVTIFLCSVPVAIAPEKRWGAVLFGGCALVFLASSIADVVSRRGIDGFVLFKVLFLLIVLAASSAPFFAKRPITSSKARTS